MRTLPRPAGCPSTTWNDRTARQWLAAQSGVTYVAMDADGTFLVNDDTPGAVDTAFAGFVPPADTARASTETIMGTALPAALTALQSIIDTADIPAGTLTAAQLSNHVRALQSAVKVESRALRRIIRLIVGDLNGAD